MSILSRVKSTVRSVAGKVSTAVHNVYQSVKNVASSAVASTLSATGRNQLPSKSLGQSISTKPVGGNMTITSKKQLASGMAGGAITSSALNAALKSGAITPAGKQTGLINQQGQPVKLNVRQSTASTGSSSRVSSSSPSFSYSAPQQSSPTQFQFSSPSNSSFSSFGGGADAFSSVTSTPATRTGSFYPASTGIQGQPQNPNSTDQQNKNVDLKSLKFPQTGPGTLPLSQVLAAVQAGQIQNVRGLEPTMSSPKVPSTVASNQLGITPQDVLSRRGEMAGTAGNLATMQASLENAQQMLDQYKAQQDALNPPVPDPIEDTPEQQDWLAQFQQQDKVNIQQELDQFKQDIGLTQVTAQRLDIMKQLNATNEVYMKIIDDIKANPELPTALAQRRMNEAYDQQKGIVLQLTGQYDVLNEQERILNDQVNQKYQILKDEQQQQQDQEKRLYDILNFMVDGGSISAMTDSELKAISARLGVPLSALKDVRTQTLKERTDKNQKTTIYSTDQGLVALTQDSQGNVTKTTNVLPKSGGGGSVVTTTASGAPTFEQYVALAEKALTSMSGGALPIKLGSAERAALKQQYDAKYTTTSGGAKFTPSEQKKLEYAGLSNASRQVQLEYLYGDSGGSSSDLFNSL